MPPNDMSSDSSPDSSPEAVRFRRATTADAEELSTFARRAFVDAFGPDNDPRDMAMYVERAFTPSVQREELADGSRVCLIGEDDGGIVAYVLMHIGASAPAVSGPQPVEIERFYVDARWHGGGVSDRMMDLVVETARGSGGQTLWLGVWERNPRAIRFYARRGFLDVGEHGFLVGNDLQTDRIMTRSLVDGDSANTVDTREQDAWPA